MEQCDECPHKARSKKALTDHRTKAHPLTEAARVDDRIALLRGLVVELAGKVKDATIRELPPIAHRLVTTSAALEEEIGRQRQIGELNAEVDRLRRSQPKEKSRVDEIAEQRARRRARRRPKAASR